jgi:hypothetical protein
MWNHGSAGLLLLQPIAAFPLGRSSISLVSRETHRIGITESSNIILSFHVAKSRISIYPLVVPKYILGVILTPRGVTPDSRPT